jgi:tRNA threonylcarbamoyladenosine biosynthesis protein TsaB
MAYILHIDTSAESGFVAIAFKGEIVASKESNDTRNHASILNNDINEVIAEIGISLEQVSAIAVCGGPGSYTGLRIALATSKAICYALDKPLMMHNKLLLLILDNYYTHLSAYDIYASILPARDNEYFISTHDNKLNAVLEPKHIFANELSMTFNEMNGKILTTGNIDVYIEQSLSGKTEIISKKAIDKDAWCQYSFAQYNRNDFVDLSSAEPYYLKQVYTHKQKNIN